MNSNLHSLNLSDNDLNKAIPLLSSALIHSKIVQIGLEDCNIDDDGLYCLFGVLRHRNLCLIDIDDNPQITILGLKKCLSMLLEEQHSRPTLYNLFLSTESLLNDENKKIIEKINSIRTKRGFPHLNVGNGIFSHIKKFGGDNIWIKCPEKIPSEEEKEEMFQKFKAERYYIAQDLLITNYCV